MAYNKNRWSIRFRWVIHGKTGQVQKTEIALGGKFFSVYGNQIAGKSDLMSASPEKLRRWEKISVVSLMVIALLGGLFFGYILSEVRTGKAISLLDQYRPATPTILYDLRGDVISELYRHKQDIVPYEELPPHLINAFLSVEDENFYDHFGIDFSAIVRAAFINLINMRIVQGGSTLTQQVAKTVTERTEKTLARKFVEAILALQIEHQYSKKEIIELYFNLIYLGHGTKGVSAASRLYFQKKPGDLTLGEAAMLARLPKAPVYYSPFKYPRRAKEIHKVVLKRMVDAGFISPKKAQKVHHDFWKAYWPRLTQMSPTATSYGVRKDRAPFFSDYVRELLKRHEKVGEDLLYTGGLKVYTTLDLKRHEKAVEIFKKQVEEENELALRQSKKPIAGADGELLGAYSILKYIVPLPGIIRKPPTAAQKFEAALRDDMLAEMEMLSWFTGSNNAEAALMQFDKETSFYRENLHLQGAFVSIDHPSGYIRSMVGGYEFSAKNQYNRVIQGRRQPGSSFKPFVYTAAIDSGLLHSARGFQNAPTTEMNEAGTSWSPENYSGGFTGYLTMDRGMAKSSNIVAVRVWNKVGGDRVIDIASKLTKVPNKSRFVDAPTTALGASELSPMEMAQAMAIFANKGKDVIPFAIRYVTDQQGNILFNRELEVRNVLAIKEKTGEIQILPEDTAYVMHQMLRRVVYAGTAGHVISKGHMEDWDVAGKTGTTSGWYDAWFVGYTPVSAGVIWLGFDRRTISLGGKHGGGSTAAPLWAKMMRELHSGYKPEPFNRPRPDNVYGIGVCKYTGLRPLKGICDKFHGGLYVTRPGVGLDLGPVCDGEHKKPQGLLELLQEKYNISDEEIGKKYGFKNVQ